MIDIAKILNNTKNNYFYSPAYGKIRLNGVIDDKIYFENDRYLTFNKFGQLDTKGECMIFPSKEMRDWGKFKWSEGDVLISGDRVIIFKWFKDNYIEFVGTNLISPNSPNPENIESVWNTEDFRKADATFADNYTCFVNAYNRVKLQFKRGDVVFINATEDHPAFIAIYEDIEVDKDKNFILYDYVRYNCSNGNLGTYDCIAINKNTYVRKASYDEKLTLFEALSKQGFKWDTIDLKLEEKEDSSEENKCENKDNSNNEFIEFNPFDKVLVRDKNDKTWQIAIFSHIDEDKNFPYIALSYNGCMWKQCIPYEGNEELLNTNYDCTK